MTVHEVLYAAREAAIGIRRIEEEAEIRRESVGVQGHTYGYHAKNGILDPMRKVDDLIEWQDEQASATDLSGPIEEAYRIMAGIRRVADQMTAEVMERYFCKGETFDAIVDGTASDGPLSERAPSLSGLTRDGQLSAVRKATRVQLENCERIGIAHLVEMGRC